MVLGTRLNGHRALLTESLKRRRMARPDTCLKRKVDEAGEGEGERLETHPLESGTLSGRCLTTVFQRDLSNGMGD